MHAASDQIDAVTAVGIAPLEPALAIIYSSGSVWWSRPGILDVLCTFTGLNKFPFSTNLTCPLDIGGWALSGTFQGVSLLDGSGVEVSRSAPPGSPRGWRADKSASWGPALGRSHSRSRRAPVA